MFGEEESESPRVPSPWDALSTAVSPVVGPTSLELKGLLEGVPKLVPEVEEGNIEYKLKLIKPSAERFARLVTQLKWRLLEGGGQAYYELGVADSGHLVGLTIQEMEESLDTLEMMAGEIGASVIVVKEIEVPALAPVRIKSTVNGISRSPRGCSSRIDSAYVTEEDCSGTTETDETELVTSDENMDYDGISISGTLPLPISRSTSKHPVRIHPPGPPYLSSPALAATDTDDEGTFTIEDLEISTVYKPLSRRSLLLKPPSQVNGEASRRGNTHSHGAKPKRLESVNAIPTDQLAKTLERRTKRDRRREEKRQAIFSLDEKGGSLGTDESDADSGLDQAITGLHIHGKQHTVDPELHAPLDADAELCPIPFVVEDAMAPLTSTNLEPRRMVEALVVRKMALEEAFLDFGGFSVVQ